MKIFFCIFVVATLLATVISYKNKLIKVTDVQLNKTELTLKVGETETLIAIVLPENADNTAVSWTNSNGRTENYTATFVKN